MNIKIMGHLYGLFLVQRKFHHFLGNLFALEVDGAEIDPAVIEAGRRHFGLEGEENRNLRPTAADGRLSFVQGRRDGFLLGLASLLMRRNPCLLR